MDLHYKQATAVGAMVVVAAVTFLFGTIWLQGRSFGTGNLYTAAFENIGSLKRGSAVRVSGVDVGSVERIDFRGPGDVAVRLALSNQSVTPREDASATITSIGIIGDVVLDYDPGSSANPLPADGEIPGTLTSGLMDMGSGIVTKGEALMDSLALLFTQRLADDLHGTFVASQRAFEVLSDTVSGPIAEMTHALAALRRLSQRLDSTLASESFGGTMANLDTTATGLRAMTEQITMATARLDTLLLNVNAGKGTLGKMATDSTLYVGLVETQAAIKALVDTLTATPGKLNIKVELF